MSALRDAISEGSWVLLHSAMGQLGHVVGGADAVIDAFLELVGPSGTLLAPTLTGDETLGPEKPPVFDPVASACWTGRIPETLRARPGAVRSLHPTHSVAALGADAEALTRDHIDSMTPCDELSPYGKLAQDDRGLIVLLGVDQESNTTMHHVEEMAGAPYHMQPEPSEATIVLPGGPVKRSTMLHLYGPERRFMVLEPALLQRGIQRNVQVGGALVRVVKSRPMVRLAVRAVTANANLLIV